MATASIFKLGVHANVLEYVTPGVLEMKIAEIQSGVGIYVDLNISQSTTYPVTSQQFST